MLVQAELLLIYKQGDVVNKYDIVLETITRIMDTFVEKLNNNPIFQLSLSSKELFHSNFLAWLAEDKNTQTLFKKILSTWLGEDTFDYNTDCMEVKREYKNFDLSICEKIINDEESETGKIRLVLENKFKSIAYKAQLENYQKKVDALNEEADKAQCKVELKLKRLNTAKFENWKGNAKLPKTKYILLTLAEDFLDKEAVKQSGWIIVTYADYSKTLHDNLDLVKDKFYKELLEKYCEFIDAFYTYTNNCLEQIKYTDNWEILKNEDFSTLRCNDIWQKLVMHQCALQLTKKLEKKFGKDFQPIIVTSDQEIWGENGTENKDKLFMRVSYYHGEALLELKYLIPQKGIFVLQQQGNHPLRAGFLDMLSKKPKYSKEHDTKNWNEETDRIIRGAKLATMVPPKKVESEDKPRYNSFGVFYYNDLNTVTKNIENTLDDMIDNINQVINLVK